MEKQRLHEECRKLEEEFRSWRDEASSKLEAGKINEGVSHNLTKPVDLLPPCFFSTACLCLDRSSSRESDIG